MYLPVNVFFFFFFFFLSLFHVPLFFAGNDRVLEGQAAYRLGQAYDKIGEGETALEVCTCISIWYTGEQFAQVNTFELLPAILNIFVVKIEAAKLFPWIIQL